MGLYPHIPHEEGLSAMREALGRPGRSSIPAEDLVDLARIVLTSNNLTFNGKHYVQLLGTAIGTKMAPSYASILMGKLESDLMERAPAKLSQFSGRDLLTFFLSGQRVRRDLGSLWSL